MKYDNSPDREREKKKRENLRDRGYIWWLSFATVFFLQRRINRRDNEQADPFEIIARVCLKNTTY